MKTMRLNLPLVFFCALVAIPLLAGCGGSGGAGAPQPWIINASFEELGANPDGGQPYAWIREGFNDWNHTTYGVQRKTAAGFMPSDGQYFLEFPASNSGTALFPGHYPLLTAYQDDVNLAGATSLVFDYEVTNVSILAGSGTSGYDGAGTVRIFFQPNAGGGGTVELWSATYGPGAAGEQILDKSVLLPSLPVPGRLSIEVSANASRQGSLISPSTLTFRIDYLGILK